MQGSMSLSHAGDDPAASAVCVHKPSIRYLQLQALFHTGRLCSGGDEAARACWGLARIGKSPGGLN